MFYSKETSVDIPEIDCDRVRKSTICRIEEITMQLIEQITSNTLPKISYYHASPNFEKVTNALKTTESITGAHANEISATGYDGLREHFDDCPNSIKSFDLNSKPLGWSRAEDATVEVHDESGTDVVADPCKLPKGWTTVDFRRKKSRKNFILIMTIMSHIHKMLINDTTRTRRSLYYELKSGNTAELVRTQRVLDTAINHVASLLDRAPWELGFTASSKGLVCGDLSLSFSGGHSMSCKVTGGVLIPQNVIRIVSARTTAKCVVVVEKDAVFQKLLDEDCVNYLNCILVTGKGYPDVNTRMLVRFLGDKLRIPVYVLVDADPFGVEIMCIYRFGSALRSRENQDLVFVDARWIGIHPSEFSALGVTPKALTTLDEARLASLENREYVDEKLLEQLRLLGKGKVEIEAVASLSYRFLTTVYLPHKIAAMDHM